MLGGLACRQCAKPLNADGNHPAEAYAGTYTGLCYACERGGAYDTGERAASGAERWSHPPHCPSWRRDREAYWYFPDCACTKGRQWISRSDAFGGSYTVNCPACWKRHIEHPATVEESRAWKAKADARLDWQIRCNAEYEKRGDGMAPEDFLRLCPPAPEGEELAVFPPGWAGRKPKKRK